MLIDELAYFALKYADSKQDAKLRAHLGAAASVDFVEINGVNDPLLRTIVRQSVPVLVIAGDFSLHIDRFGVYTITHVPSGDALLERGWTHSALDIDTALHRLERLSKVSVPTAEVTAAQRKDLREAFYAKEVA